jgi:hypothetical protein
MTHATVILTREEAETLLQRLDDDSFGNIRCNKKLMTVILKLSGDIPTGPNEIWVLKYDENKVAMIKSVRTLLNLGLKEAKDYADGLSNMRRANGDVVIKTHDVRAELRDIVEARGHVCVYIHTEVE